MYSREFLFIKKMHEQGELGKIQHLAASHPQDMLPVDLNEKEDIQ